MHLKEIEPGLWRWTARHPEATADPEPGSSADWPAEVGCVAASVAGGFAFIDPLAPREDAGGFWREADRAVAARGGPVWALATIKFHRRDRDRFARRYEASTSRAAAGLPEGVRPIPLRGAGETMFWLKQSGALVPGDRLLGDGEGGLRLCPDSWLGYLGSRIGSGGLREIMRPLLDLPVEHVLVSHGDPVIGGGREAIAAALAGAA